MEVEGRITASQSGIVLCKPCEDGSKRVPANGICRECEEDMCIACFGNHKKYKMCKDHNFADLNATVSDASETKEDCFETCLQHSNENIKFYCSSHDAVGCGDCMILQHKACKVEYVRDKASSFKDSKEFSDIVSQIDSCHNETSQCCVSLGNNKIQIEDIHLGFLADIKTFRDELNAHFDRLEHRLLQERDQAKASEKQHIESLETSCEDLEIELSEMSDEIVHKSDDPNKLFVAAIKCRHRLNGIKQRLGNIMSRNKISDCRFQRNHTIEQLFKQVELGTCRTEANDSVPEMEEPEPEKEEPGYEEPVTSLNTFALSMSVKVKPETVQLPVRQSSRRKNSSKDIPWSLFENQLRCENLLMAGEYLSFKENERCEPGLYIGKKAIKTGFYFEIEITYSDSNGNIGIGFVPKDYSLKQQPGHGRFSIGYHSKDGCIYDEDTSGERIGPPCTVGDVMGIGVSSYLSNVFKTRVGIFFTRNRKKIREIETSSPSFSKLYPAIGLQSAGEKVRVIMKAK